MEMIQFASFQERFIILATQLETSEFIFPFLQHQAFSSSTTTKGSRKKKVFPLMPGPLRGGGGLKGLSNLLGPGHVPYKEGRGRPPSCL